MNQGGGPLPWVEKYRPTSISNIVGHQHVIAALKKFIETQSLPHMLFYGPPGTGKTTTAYAVARELYQGNYEQQVLELNASDDRGIDIVRQRIKNFANQQALFSKKHKLIILDESDAMTAPAQSALRRIMEKFTKNARFILICNYPERLEPALRSRCTEFRFPPMARNSIQDFLEGILQKENVEYTKDGIDAIIRLGGGDMRRSINLLQTTALNKEKVDETTVYASASYPLPDDISHGLDSLMNLTTGEALKDFRRLLKDNGYALMDVIKEIHRQFVLFEMEAKPMARCLDRLSEIERRLQDGSSESVQISSVVAAFQMLRAEMDEY